MQLTDNYMVYIINYFAAQKVIERKYSLSNEQMILLNMCYNGYRLSIPIIVSMFKGNSKNWSNVKRNLFKKDLLVYNKKVFTLTEKGERVVKEFNRELNRIIKEGL